MSDRICPTQLCLTITMPRRCLTSDIDYAKVMSDRLCQTVNVRHPVSDNNLAYRLSDLGIADAMPTSAPDTIPINTRVYNDMAMANRVVDVKAQLIGILQSYYENTIGIEKVKEYLLGEKEELSLFLINEGAKALVDDLGVKSLLDFAKEMGFDITIDVGKANSVVNALSKLAEDLNKHEVEFYEYVTDSENVNFLITTYYSLYLDFLFALRERFSKIGDDVNTISLAIFIVNALSVPIYVYLTTGVVPSYLKDLEGILLRVFVE